MTCVAATRPAGPPRRPEGSRPPRGPDVHRWARVFAQLLVEVEAGRRPLDQLAPLLTRELYLRLAGVWANGEALAVVDGVVGMQPAPEVFEAVAMLRRGKRRSALAFRLTRRGGCWLCDELGVPERGPLPRASSPVPD